MSQVELAYNKVRGQIADGDLLLWRPTSLLGRGISVMTRGDYSHAAMAAWWNETLMHLDLVFTGGRAVTLSSQVRQCPGKIDWFQANAIGANWAAHRTVSGMVRRAGTRYGFYNLFRNMLSYSMLTRWLVRPNTDDSSNGHDAVCSQGVSAEYRAGGIDPVLLLGDAWTSPSDLANSLFFRYMGTLVP